MKILRNIALEAQQRQQVVSLEAQINEMLDFAYSLPVATPSLRMSLESVVNHIRPDPRHRFTIANYAQEEISGWGIAGILALVAAIAIAIKRFIGWMFGGSSGGGGGGGGGGGSVKNWPEKAKKVDKIVNDHKIEAATNKVDAAIKHAVHEAAASETIPKEKKHDIGAIHGIDTMIERWAKRPGNEDHMIQEYLKNTNGLYRDFASAGPYFRKMLRVADKSHLNQDLLRNEVHWITSLTKTINKLVSDGEVTDVVLNDSFIANMMPGMGGGESHRIYTNPQKLSLPFFEEGKLLTFSEAAAILRSWRTELSESTTVKPTRFTDFGKTYKSHGLIALVEKCCASIVDSQKVVEEIEEGMGGLDVALTSLNEMLKNKGIDDPSVRKAKGFLSVITKYIQVSQDNVLGYAKYIAEFGTFAENVGRMLDKLVHCQKGVDTIIKAECKELGIELTQELKTALETLREDAEAMEKDLQ
jgi:hypothetical protein